MFQGNGCNVLAMYICKGQMYEEGEILIYFLQKKKKKCACMDKKLTRGHFACQESLVAAYISHILLGNGQVKGLVLHARLMIH